MQLRHQYEQFREKENGYEPVPVDCLKRLGILSRGSPYWLMPV